VREALAAAIETELGVLPALTPASGYVPDFLTPPATSPFQSFADELERVRHTPPEVVRREVAEAFGGREMPPAVTELVAEPRRGIERLGSTMEIWWRRTIEAHWPRIRAMLDADLTHRARRLTEGGPAGLFGDLHRTVRWRDDHLEVSTMFDARVELGGRGLDLVSSAFSWQGVGPIIDPAVAADAHLPRPGAAVAARRGRPASPGASDRAVTRRPARRARGSAVDDRPGAPTRTQPGAASQHLAALHGAGLLTAARRGREVLYLRTPLADELHRSASA
jgi:hypothetical protein